MIFESESFSGMDLVLWSLEPALLWKLFSRNEAVFWAVLTLLLEFPENEFWVVVIPKVDLNTSELDFMILLLPRSLIGG